MPRPLRKKPIREPLTVDVEEGAEIIGVTRPTVYRYIKSGQLKSFTLGRRRLIRISDLERFLDDRVQETAEA